MKSVFLALTLFLILPNISRAQNIAEADIPTIKEIQTTILSLMVKAVSDFAGVRGSEVYKDDDLQMFNASAEPGMHAGQYYLTYIHKNNRNFYMSWYTDPHDQLLITTAVMTMYAYAGDKWKTVPEGNAADGMKLLSLFCGDTKIGLLRVDTKANAVSFTVGFFTEPGGTAPAPAPKSAPAAPEKNSMLDYGIFDTHTSTSSAAAHDYKVYCFTATCSQNGKSFKVVSKVTADLGKHSLEDMRAEALHRLSNNGWLVQGNLDYLGLASDVSIQGVAGRDYAVSETQLYD